MAMMKDVMLHSYLQGFLLLQIEFQYLLMKNSLHNV